MEGRRNRSGKTLTITDDALGATALVRIEQTGTASRVTEIRFTAEPGRSLSSAALTLLEDLGLRLPDTLQPPAPAPAPAPVRAAARKAAPVRKAAAKKAASRPAPRPARPLPPAAAPAQALAAAAEPLPPAAPEPEPAAPEPQPAAAPEPQPAEPEPAAPPAAAEPAAPQQRRPRRSGPPPTVQQLREAFRGHRGNYAAVAEQFGASQSSVNNWIRKARESGERIDLIGLNPSPVS